MRLYTRRPPCSVRETALAYKIQKRGKVLNFLSYLIPLFCGLKLPLFLYFFGFGLLQNLAGLAQQLAAGVQFVARDEGEKQQE